MTKFKLSLELIFVLIIMISLTLIPITINAEEDNTIDNLKITVSNTDIGPIVKVIGGSHVELTALLPPGSDPHGFSLTQESIDDLENSDLIVLINSEFLHYEEQVIENYPDKNYVDFKDYEANGLELKDFPLYKNNPHGYWLGWDNAIAIAKTITDALENSTLSKYSTDFRDNLVEFENSITALQDSMQQFMKDTSLNGKRFVAAVPGVNYIIDNLGLEVGAVLLAEGAGFVSGGELAEIESKLEDGTYSGIICPQSMRSAKAGEISEQVAKDTGSKVIYVKFLASDLDSDYITTAYYNGMIITSGLAMQNDENSSSINYYIIALVLAVLIALVEAFIIYKFKVQAETIDNSEELELFAEKKSKIEKTAKKK